jgi:acetolactate synthase I/II/III large subunit
MKLSGAQITIETLLAHGIDTVFGYPGGAVLTLYDELEKSVGKIRHILTAHEQGAVHAADGYARVSGKTGVVFATSGPGATNLVTGIANAYLDSVPLLAITGNVALSLLGKDSFQEVDIVGITQPVVKHSFVVHSVDKLEFILNEAFRVANSGRRGPVLVDIPRSVQSDICEYTGIPPSSEKEQPLSFNIEQIAAAIKNCKKPFIYSGGGVVASGAEKELQKLSEKLSAPIGFSMMGLTALPYDYPMNLGMCGMHGRYASTIAQSECDVMIALGVRFSDRATGNTDSFGQGRIIIHVDIDLSEIGKNVTPHIEVCGDVKKVLPLLLKVLPDIRNEEWLERINELRKTEAEHASNNLFAEVSGSGGFSPQNIIKTVRRYCEDDTVIATDVGQHQMWVIQNYYFQKPRTMLTSGGLGAMGFGLGAAIGASIAQNKKRTVLFTSDGSFGMNLIELATAVTEELPITIIILNNGTLGMVRQWQAVFCEERYAQTTLNRKTDFAALAKAFGAEGHRAANITQLEGILKNLSGNVPVVIDCPIDINEKVYPMIPPGGSVDNIIIGG